jgi:uncharacterized protein with HEPN domain
MSAPDDQIRVRHMLEAAREAMAFAQGKKREDLDQDRLLVLGLIKAVEIVGEAASKISREYQADHPKVPWAAIIAMRNILIHVYFGIDLDEVWSTVQDDLPPLIAELEALVQDQ